MDFKIYSVSNNYKGGAIIAESGENTAVVKFSDAYSAESFVGIIKKAVEVAINDGAEYFDGESYTGGGIIYSDTEGAPILHCEDKNQAAEISNFISEIVSWQID